MASRMLNVECRMRVLIWIRITREEREGIGQELRDDPWCIICYLNHVTSCCLGCWELGTEIIPRDSIYACLNVFDCALLIQIKFNSVSDSTTHCSCCCCLSCGKLSWWRNFSSHLHFHQLLGGVAAISTSLQKICYCSLNLTYAFLGCINFSDSLRLLALIKSVKTICISHAQGICN